MVIIQEKRALGEANSWSRFNTSLRFGDVRREIGDRRVAPAHPLSYEPGVLDAVLVG